MNCPACHVRTVPRGARYGQWERHLSWKFLAWSWVRSPPTARDAQRRASTHSTRLLRYSVQVFVEAPQETAAARNRTCGAGGAASAAAATLPPSGAGAASVEASAAACPPASPSPSDSARAGAGTGSEAGEDSYRYPPALYVDGGGEGSDPGAVRFACALALHSVCTLTHTRAH